MEPDKIIYFATGNDDKVDDFRLVFDQLKINLAKLEKIFPVHEDGRTLIENAKLKALTNSRCYPAKVIMATDGGVRIPFLGDNWNHVLTRRLSGIDHEGTFTDRERAKTLLSLMKRAATNEERRLFWEEAVVLAYNDKVVFEFVGSSEPGVLLREFPEDFQETGFWVGYLWYDVTLGKTYMQMTEEEKLQQSKIKQNLIVRLSNFDFALSFGQALL